jgi:conjugative transfer signal peptidase TraF
MTIAIVSARRATGSHRRVRRAITASVLIVAGVAAICSGSAQPLLLINTTPSEPSGVYLQVARSPARGQIVAFPAPPSAFPYADARLGFLHRVPILKAVAARSGDSVCSRSGRLSINGRDVAAVAERDSRGARLPHWAGCCRLRPGELFVVSNRVPNSFDSRYFGPISTRSLIGVYRPLLVVGGR